MKTKTFVGKLIFLLSRLYVKSFVSGILPICMWEKVKVHKRLQNILMLISLCINYQDIHFWLTYSIIYLVTEHLLQTFWHCEMEAFYKLLDII